MIVAVYVRVSTHRQAQAQSTEQPVERLLAHSQSRGLQLQDQNLFRDDGYSGSSLNRPGLDHLRDKAAASEIDLILITAPDRLARKYVHQVLLLEELERYGCQVEFLERPMTETPHDQLLLQIRGAVAEYERSLIVERMRRGRQTKLEAGMLLPWPKPLFGYRSDPVNPRDPARRRVDQAEAAVVQEIFAYYAEEETSLWGLAKHLEAHQMPAPGGKQRWNASTIRWILQNPAYGGQVWAGRSRVVASRSRRSATQPVGSGRSLVTIPRENWIAGARIPAIITPQQFDLVQEKLARNRSFAKRNNKSHEYLLRALVSCGQCGLACVGRWMKGGYCYYRCLGKTHPYQSHKEERCRARFSPANQLDEIVWEDLCEVIEKPEMIAQAVERSQAGDWLPQQLQARRENLRRGRASLDQQLERLTQAYLTGVVMLEEYGRRRNELEQRGKALESQQRELEKQVDRQSEIAGLKSSMEEFCQRVRVGLEGATFEQQRRLVELLIDRVVVKDGEVEIRYVIPTSRRGELTRFCQLRSNYQRSQTGQNSS